MSPRRDDDGVLCRNRYLGERGGDGSGDHACRTRKPRGIRELRPVVHHDDAESSHGGRVGDRAAHVTGTEDDDSRREEQVFDHRATILGERGCRTGGVAGSRGKVLHRPVGPVEGRRQRPLLRRGRRLECRNECLVPNQRLDDDVDRPSAGQAEVTRDIGIQMVGADQRPVARRRLRRCEDVRFDAPAADRSFEPAGGTDQHLRPHRYRRGSERARDRRQRAAVARACQQRRRPPDGHGAGSSSSRATARRKWVSRSTPRRPALRRRRRTARRRSRPPRGSARGGR